MFALYESGDLLAAADGTYSYICIDLKSYYASVECVARGLDPLTARLLVADETRTDKTICLAVSPALKVIGVPGRPRLFEAKECIRRYEAEHRCKVDYIIAPPRMAAYIRVSAQIYAIYLRYASEEDIHVYSIDEVFIDATPYLHLYRKEAEKQGLSPAYCMAATILRDVLKDTGITATVGIGTNMYLAKICMDIVAKKQQPNPDGARIAELDEIAYRLLLWTHRPLTDFWQISHGIARRLASRGMHTMGDVAAMSLHNPGCLYELLGINAGPLIDHAWGTESTRMTDIKSYRPTARSLSSGQVLSRPYKYHEALLIFTEMSELLCDELLAKGLTTTSLTWHVCYDPASLEVNPQYRGPVLLDYYGRPCPKHTVATARLRRRGSSKSEIMDKLLPSFSEHVDHLLLIRRIGVCANDIEQDDGCLQTDLFTDIFALEKERELQLAVIGLRKRYGMNAVVKGADLLDYATTMQRNGQIGGHRAEESR